jgi:hypothetical protein
MVRQVPLTQLRPAALRAAAEQVENTQGLGKKDGVITSEEVDKALALAATQPATFGDLASLRTLKTFLTHMGAEGGASQPLGAGGYSPLTAMSGNMTGTVQTVKDPVILSDPKRADVTTAHFDVAYDQRSIADRQSVVVPLDGKELHLIELKYQDTRKLRDLEFNYRDKGSSEWKTFRGDQYAQMLAKEKSGEVQIKRESDHNSPWINNPIRVKVDVLYPNGDVHQIGTKFLDFHVHDAHGPDSSGYPETDNISNGYEKLPSGKLPEGCLLRLTPLHQNRKPWETDRQVAMDISWVKPTYMPDHKARVEVFSAGGFQKPRPEGYAVDPNRKIAAVMVTWTDHGGTASAGVSIGKTESGPFRSQSYNVGSGETELIPVGRYAQDGRIKVEGGHNVDVSRIQVLYAD